MAHDEVNDVTAFPARAEAVPPPAFGRNMETRGFLRVEGAASDEAVPRWFEFDSRLRDHRDDVGAVKDGGSCFCTNHVFILNC